eukprot:878662-Karenia_brevis.AAC.1
MSGERRRLRQELDDIHEYCTTQVGKLEQLLDEDLDDCEQEAIGIEDRCKARMLELNEQMGQTMSKQLEEIELCR